MNTVNLDGGEFEDCEKYCIPIEQIPLLVDKIGKLLVALKPELKESNKFPFYCFRVASKNILTLNHMILELEDNLPLGCKIYSCNGQKVFEMRGSSGGVLTSCCFYLIAK